MDKKILAFILVAVGLLAITAGVVLFFTSIKNESQKNINQSTETKEETAMDKNTKTLVVYFSAQNHTRNVAAKIAANINADIFEIEPVETYTEEDLSWTSSDSRVSREHNDVSLQNVTLKSVSVPNWDEYETVFLGYPIWWGGSAWPVDSFVKQIDFSNKTIIPFCTSHSSGLGTSDTDLKAKATGGNWQPGHCFSQDAADAEIKDWIKSL